MTVCLYPNTRIFGFFSRYARKTRGKDPPRTYPLIYCFVVKRRAPKATIFISRKLLSGDD